MLLPKGLKKNSFWQNIAFLSNESFLLVPLSLKKVRPRLSRRWSESKFSTFYCKFQAENCFFLLFPPPWKTINFRNPYTNFFSPCKNRVWGLGAGCGWVHTLTPAYAHSRHGMASLWKSEDILRADPLLPQHDSQELNSGLDASLFTPLSHPADPKVCEFRCAGAKVAMRKQALQI